MTQPQKYYLYVLSILMASVYILLTESWDRWSSVYQQYTALSEETSKIMNPEEASKRKLELSTELSTLRASLVSSSGGFDQSEAGLVELVGESAKRESIRIADVIPTELEGGAGVLLQIQLLGTYHRIVAFLNHLENSPIAVRLDKLEISRQSERVLHAKMALRATFLRLSVKR